MVPGSINTGEGRGRTEDSGGTVRPGFALSRRSVVLPLRQTVHTQGVLLWLLLAVVLKVLAGCTVVGHVGGEGNVPVLECCEEEVVVLRWRLVVARFTLIVWVAAVVDDTLQLGAVHIVGLPPVAGGAPALHQLGV